jgi:hypothetical protein
MDNITIVILKIIYLLIFRLSIVIVGVISIILGYRLFVKGVFPSSGNAKDSSEFSAKVGEMNLTFRNAAPGTLFALFGAVLIVVMIVYAPPEFEMTKKTDPNGVTEQKIMRDIPAEKPCECPKPNDVPTTTPEKISEIPTKHALLVGVSHYPNLDDKFQLQGPTNDVALLKAVLLDKGFADNNIHVLTDNVIDSGRLPTRQNILAAFKHLTEQVKADDSVFVYFSGHGSQQPVSLNSSTHRETDGLDEFFLPRDIGAWQDDTKTVENALLDNEMNKWITAWRNKGVFVWAVFDSCHSGTMLKGVKVKGLRERKISSRDLGIPSQNITQSTESETFLDDDSKTLKGGYVAFYAAQTDQVTPEMPLGQENKTHGLFTYILAQVLAQNDGITYRQAAQQILHRYAAKNYLSPTPLFEGTQLDTLVFRTDNKYIPQWSLKQHRQKLKIAAGQLHQLDKGSILAVLPNPTAHDDQVLGYVEIENATILESRLKPVAFNNKLALDINDIPQNAWARLVAPKLSLTLTVALPPKMIENQLAEQAENLLSELSKEEQTSGIKITWVQPEETEADLRLLIKSDQLWLLPPTGELIETGATKTHSIRLNKTPEQLREVLVNSFQSIAKVINLLRLSSQTTANSKFAKKLNINGMFNANEKTFGINKIPVLSPGNKLTFKVKNNSQYASDVTMLFIDSAYGITALYPDPGASNRIQAANDDWIEGEPDVETVGIERMIIIAVQAEANTMRTDFSFLAQPRLDQTKDYDKFTADQKNLYDLFVEAGFGNNNKNFKKSAKPLTQTVMQIFTWETKPE